MGSWKNLLALVALSAGLALTGCSGSSSKNTSDGGGGDSPRDPYADVDPYEKPGTPRQCLLDKGQTAGPLNNLPSIVGGQRLTKEGPIGRAAVHIQVIQQVFPDGRASFSSCSATLIGTNMVITAAHCFPQGMSSAELARRTRVTFSIDPHPICGRQEYRQAEAVTIHGGWNGSADVGNDLAMIRIEGTAPNEYQPMPVLTRFPENFSQVDSYLAGYGKNIDDVQSKVRTEVSALKIAVVKAYAPRMDLPLELRGRVDGMNYNSADAFSLAYDTSKGSAMCPGDSGGPATFKENGMVKLIGVASYVRFPSDNPTCKLTAVYMSLPYYRAWLERSYADLANALSTPNPFELVIN